MENSAFPVLFSLLNASLSLKKESGLEINLRNFISSGLICLFSLFGIFQCLLGRWTMNDFKNIGRINP